MTEGGGGISKSYAELDPDRLCTTSCCICARSMAEAETDPQDGLISQNSLMGFPNPVLIELRDPYSTRYQNMFYTLSGT
jgi:hypothetical protein